MNITIALVGNPNSGKTTLFNALTGSNQYVGNWPGVTVERREAAFEIGGDRALLVDLPGVYSLTPYSIEETITREFILREQPDVVLNVVDATNPERNLYLTLQLLEQERPVVIALNLMDELERRGGKIDCAALATALNAPVTPVSARMRQGFDALFEAIHAQAHAPIRTQPALRYNSATGNALRQLSSALGGAPIRDAIPLLESGDAAPENPRISRILQEYARPDSDAFALLADARYGFIERALARAGFRAQPPSGRIDRIATHRLLAFPIFAAVMALMLAAAFGPIGKLLSGTVEFTVQVVGAWAAAGLDALHAPAWFSSLILDGVIAGVGGVAVFLPQILLVFLFMTLLEDSGYMARAAFITDRLLRGIGLSGRSFIPLLMGFGCTAAAILAARGVENERDRRMTILLAPFMSCGARLPVYALFASAFFPGGELAVALALYALGMLMMALCGFLLRRTAFRSGESPFLLELPPWRMPDPASVLRRMRDRARDFLVRAGTLIFAMSVAVWFLRSFTPAVQWTADPAESVFGRIGALIAPVFAPMGFGQWEKAAALLAGLAAKEAVVSTLQVLYSAGSVAALTGAVAARFTPASACAFLVFVLLYVPCVTALAAARRELHSGKYFILSIALQLGAAWTASLLTYRVCLHLFGG